MKQCRSRLVSQVEITLPDKIKVDDVIMTNFHNDKTSSADECKSNAVFKHITSFNRNSNIDDRQGTIFIDVNSSLNNFSLPGNDKNQTPTMCSDCVHNIYSDGVFMEYDTTVQNANSINLSNTQDEFDYTTWNELQIEGNQDSADHDCTYDDMTDSIMRGSGESFCQIDYILKNIHVTKDIGSTEEHDSNTNLKNSINLNQNSNMDSGPSTLPVDENWSPHNFSLPGTDKNQVSCYNCENDKNPEDASFVCGTNSINASITPDEFDYVTWNRLQMRRHQGSGDQDCKCHVISSGMKNKTESFHEVDDLLGNDQASESTRFIDEYDNNQYLKNPKSFKQNSSTDSEHSSISICENSSRQNFSLSGTNTSHTKCGECDSDTYSQGVFLEYDAIVQNRNSDHTNTLHGVDEFDYISWNKLQMKRRRINSVEETCKHTLQ